MTRVWLTNWEWGCCGDPFVVGDDVDFDIATRTIHPLLADDLGQQLADTVDAVESHHEEEFTDRVRGRVVAVHAVTQGYIERRSLRRPGHGAPGDAVAPPEGEDWPLIRHGDGDGVGWGIRPSRYVIASEPIPDSAELVPVVGLRRPFDEASVPPGSTRDLDDPPPERRTRSRTGWLVDVEEHSA